MTCGWFFRLLLVAQVLWTCYNAPTRLENHHHHHHHHHQHSHRVKLVKSKSDAEKKAHRKTTVSINGQFLPLAQLSSNEKNIHVTVQKANPDGQQAQAPTQQASFGAQNVTTQGTQIPTQPQPGSPSGQPPGLTTTGNQTLQIPLQVTNPGTPTQGMSPGIINPGTQTLGISPGISIPGTLILGKSPDMTNPAVQTVGLSPGITNVPNPPNQDVVAATPHSNCATNNLQPGQNNFHNPNTNGNQMMVVGKNSEGQLTYRPVSC